MRKAFDPARVRALLEAVEPICRVIEDYQTHNWGRTYEAHDRMIGRVARDGSAPPYVTWGQLCAIENAAYALAKAGFNEGGAGNNGKAV